MGYNGPTVRVVIAPQAFKGSLSALEACRAIQEGVRRVWPQADTALVPMADGGDGTLEVLVDSSGGTYRTSRVTGPQGDALTATWGLMGDGETAVIEMARASGLALLPLNRLDVRTATSYGTGELIKTALDAGAHRLILGIGGSATNDGGAGLAAALGVRFLDQAGHDLPPGGAALARLHRIDTAHLDPRLPRCPVLVACDVTNPLTGPQGASAIYGPQKGASPEAVQELDHALAHYATVIRDRLGKEFRDIPGTGAAGGVAVALLAFGQAELCWGGDLVAKAVGLEERLRGADLVFTGEGQLDASTTFNKAPIGVARRAKEREIPVIAVVGSLGPGYQDAMAQGIDAVECLADQNVSLEQAMRNAYPLLRDAAERAAKRA